MAKIVAFSIIRTELGILHVEQELHVMFYSMGGDHKKVKLKTRSQNCHVLSMKYTRCNYKGI